MATTKLVEMVFMAALIYCIYLPVTQGAKFFIENQCAQTIWAAGAPYGGGQELRPGQSWTAIMPESMTTGRIWGRKNCSFDQTGQGPCQTDIPATMVEYSLNESQNMDSYSISLLDGFNIPLSVAPTNEECTKIDCPSNINAICPTELKVEGACKNACLAFQRDAYCCRGNYSGNNCDDTLYSNVFKKQCPMASVYSSDSAQTTFTCPSGTDFKIVFCPPVARVFVLLLVIE